MPEFLLLLMIFGNTADICMSFDTLVILISTM